MFKNAGQSEEGHFCIGCGGDGNDNDGKCNCTHHQYHLWLIMNNLESVRARFGHSMDIINSGYRCPIKNANTDGADSESKHIYGLAADVKVQDWNGDGKPNKADWQLLHDAAVAEGATVEKFTKTGTWVHMNW